MAETIGTYYFQLAPSAEGVSEKMSAVLGDAGKDAGGSIASGLSGALTGVAGVAGAALAGVTAAVGTLTGAIVESGEALLDATVAAAEYGDNVDKMSQKANMSATSWQEWQAVLSHSGASASSLIPIMKTLSVQAEKNNEAFQALGISEEQVATMSQEDLFSAVITGLQGMEEGTERTYIANQLLGRGATELGALLNTSAEETQAMKDRLHELGGVMSDEDVKAAAQFQDSLQDMQTGFEGMQRNLVSGFLPSMSKVMDGMGDLFAGNNAEGLKSLSAGVKDFVKEFADLVPTIMSVGGELVGTLTQTILQNLPSLITVGGEQLLALVQGLTDNAPMLLSAAQEVLRVLLTEIQTLIPQILPMIQNLMFIVKDAVEDAIPILLPIAMDIVTSFVETVVSLGPAGFEGGTALLMAVADGLMGALPSLISLIPTLVDAMLTVFTGQAKMFMAMGTYLFTQLLTPENVRTITEAIIPCIPQITDSIIAALTECLPLFVEAGFVMFVALVDNLPGILTELGFAVTQIADSLLMALADLIVSFEDIGEQIMMGLADGIVNAGDSVVATAKEVLGKIPQGAKDLFQINSPSKLFEGYGQYIDEGLAIGIASNANMPEDAMATMTSDTIASYRPTTASEASAQTVQSGGGASGDIVIPVYIGQERIDEIIVQANNRVNYVSGGH